MTDAGKQAVQGLGEVEIVELIRPHLKAYQTTPWDVTSPYEVGGLYDAARAIVDRLSADGEAPTGGYAGVKDAEVNKSLPTQGGGAGDRERLIDLLSDWFETVPGFTDTGEGTIKGKPERDFGFSDVEFSHFYLADAILSALQAAPSEGGEPVAWVWEDAIGDSHSTTRKDMVDYLTLNGIDVQPAYARPPAPSEEPLVVKAARAVVLAAWTDRHNRLHGHETVVALKAALEAAAPTPDAIRGGE